MVTANTLAAQGQQLRQILPTTPLLRIIAKTLGSVSRPLAAGPLNGDNPPISRDQWLADTADLQGVAESDLLAFIADQLARIFLYRNQTGLTILGDSVSFESTDGSWIADNLMLDGMMSLKFRTPNIEAGTVQAGTPLRTTATDGTVDYGLVFERFEQCWVQGETASRNLSNDDNGRTLIYYGSTPITFTIPIGFATGLKFRVIQAGTGKVTMAGSGGVTVNGRNGHVSTLSQWSVIDIIQVAPTTCVVYGDVGA